MDSRERDREVIHMPESKYRKVGRNLIAIGLTAAMLSACGTRFQDEPDTTTPAAAEDITLTYWSMWNEGEPQHQIFEQLREDFTAETGIEIDVRYLGRQVGDNLVNALGTGTGPDLYDMSNQGLSDYHNRGFVTDLDPLLEMEIPGEGITVGETIAPGIIDAASTPDGLGILPTHVTSNAMWFNATRFPEFTEDPPATWDEFIAVLDEIKADGEVPLGADGSVAGYNLFWFYQGLMRHGGPGALRELGEDPENWTQGHVRAAADMVEQLVQGDYFQQDYMGTQYPAAQVAWANDEYAFMLNGTYMGGETAELEAEGFEAYTFMFPMVEGGKSTIEITPTGLAISADSEYTDAAMEFLAFAAKKEYQGMYSTEAGTISARTDVEAPPSLGPVAEAIAQADTVTGSADGASSANPGWWNDIMLPLSNELFSGSIEAEEFIAEGQIRTAEYLANN